MLDLMKEDSGATGRKRARRVQWLSWALLIAAGACEGPGEKELAGRYAGVVEFRETRLGFQVAGVLQSRRVDRGAEVKAGETLAELDLRLDQAALRAQQSQVQAARADVALAKAPPKREDVEALERRVQAARALEDGLRRDVDRDQRLAREGAIPAAQAEDRLVALRRAEAERASLQAQLASLRRGARTAEVEVRSAREEAARANVALQDERMRLATLVAPEAGYVLDVYAEPGEVVAAGVPVVALADRDHPLVEVFVPIGKVAGLAVGRKARARVDAYPDEFAGQIEAIYRTTEYTPRYIFSDSERPRLVVRVRVQLSDPERRLIAGVPAFVQFEGS